MRFGLMTFDQDPSAGIGVTTGGNPTVLGNGVVDAISPSFGAFAGMWSYFPGWNTGAACTHYGEPPNCANPSLLAVGARNPAAPPWEGRMMPFPATNDLGRAGDEQPEHRQRRPRHAPLRRHAARGHAPGRGGLLLDRPDRPAEAGPARLLRQPPAVHHPP